MIEFETRHRVLLPDAYRAFLLEVGNGGAGPHYGLDSLDQAGRESERLADRWPNYLATPFPHTTAWNPENYVPVLRKPAVGLTEDEYFDDRWTTGSIVIGNFGCGAVHRLVVSGPARGQVWFDDRPSDGGLLPEANFRDWYESWLTAQA